MLRSVRVAVFVLAWTGFLSGQTRIVRIWPEGAPGAMEDEAYQETFDTDRPYRLRNVSDPTLSLYLPHPGKSNGTAVVICPGGGYVRLALDCEGFEVARWLNTLGVAGILLKYRLPDNRIMEDKSVGPLQDVQEAVRIVRRNASGWGIDPHRIGVMGFSAGGHLAATASTLYDEPVYKPVDSTSARPDFSVLIYPVISFRDSVTHEGSRKRLLGSSPSVPDMALFSADERVNRRTPPAFLVHSIDDRAVSIENTLRYSRALILHGVPCEVHLFESDGHGYGISRGKGTEVHWPKVLEHWLRMHGLI